MSVKPTNVATLADEYVTLVQETSTKGPRRAQADMASVRSGLIKMGEWTPEAADALIGLAQDYGAFMLRNALALAVALNIEDGSLGY